MIDPTPLPKAPPESSEKGPLPTEGAGSGAERALSIAARLQRAAASLAAHSSVDQIAKAIVEQGADVLRASTGAVVEPLGDRLHIVATHGVPAAKVARFRSFDADAGTPIGLAYQSRSAVWFETPEALAHTFPRLDVPPNSTAAAIPLIVGDRVRAVVGFRFDGARTFDPEERAILEAMAAQAAGALDRADSNAREAVARRRVESLGILARALSRALTPEDVAAVVVEQGTRAAEADTCTLYSLDEGTRWLHLVGEQGVAPEVLEHSRRITPQSGNPAYGTLASGELLWAEDEEQYARLYPSLVGISSTRRRVTAFWAAPLVAEGRVIGLLGMGFYEAHALPPDERAFVTTFVRVCAEGLLRARRLEAERVARTLAEQLQASLSTTLKSIGDAVVATDPEGQITILNAAATTLTGWSEGDARGLPVSRVLRIVDEATRQPLPFGLQSIADPGGVAVPRQGVLLRKDGVEVPVEDTRSPIRAEDGAIEGVVVVFRDVTAKKREERRRLLLADATAALAESLDYEETLTKVAQLAVPGWADWCAVDIVREGERRPKRLAVAHVDPQRVQFASELDARYPPDPDAATGVPNVLRTGKSELYPDIPDALLVAGCVDEEHLRISRGLGLRSAMVVPLAARGRTLGAMTFVFAESGRRYDADDLHFAEELARRCAVALDNAKLFALEQRARRNADLASQAKDEFLAMVSHELRTPLNAIMGWTKMLGAPALDEPRRSHALEIIGRNAEAMARLVEDLLDMSRIVSGKMRLEVQPVTLERVIEAALESIRPAAEAKKIRVSSTFADGPGTRTAVSGDPARLQQVVWNLLSNAVKFTPGGGRVDVALRITGSWVEIAVADSGRGIAPQFLPHVFDAFRQEDASTSRTWGGLGLGLAITRQLVELHGGRIRAQSAGEGRGAEFTVYLPVSAVVPAEVPKGSDRPPPSLERREELAGVRVLAVDDDEDSRELVRVILETAGCRVTVAESTDAALRAIAREVPDVLLSDIGMPDRDGFELIREVRSLPASRGGDTPAAALTAYARADDRRRLLEAGFLMHVAKPVDPAEVVAVITSLRRFARPRAR